MRIRLLFCLCGGLLLPSFSDGKTIKFVTGLSTLDGRETSKPIWSYELHELITKNLYGQDGKPLYQDFELISNTCFGYDTIGMIKDKGLLGTWSLSASVGERQAQKYDYATKQDKTP